jgi:hypothetical protein
LTSYRLSAKLLRQLPPPAASPNARAGAKIPRDALSNGQRLSSSQIFTELFFVQGELQPTRHHHCRRHLPRLPAHLIPSSTRRRAVFVAWFDSILIDPLALGAATWTRRRLSKQSLTVVRF